MTGPKPHVRRDENRPIGNVPDTGRGAGNVGRTAMDLLQREWLRMIVRAGNGDVFVIDPAGLRAEATADVHPEWICGTYTHRCGAGTIAGDLVAQVRQLRKVAA
jgi:hypothetical protein